MPAVPHGASRVVRARAATRRYNRTMRATAALLLAVLVALAAPLAAMQAAPARPAPSAPQPSQPPPIAPAPAREATPSEQQLGVPIFPAAQFIRSYDAGHGQRYYLFGSQATLEEVVAYYRTALKQ